jgi:hypothetical protein
VIGDVDALVERGEIVPGDRERSALYPAWLMETCPPVAVELPRPIDDEIEFIGQFIDAMY